MVQFHGRPQTFFQGRAKFSRGGGGTVISFPKFDARGHSKVLGDFQPIIPKSGVVPNYRLRIIANPKKVETFNQGLGKPYFYPEKVIFHPIQLNIKMVP